MTLNPKVVIFVVFSVDLVFKEELNLMRGDKCHPGRGKRGKIPLLPNNVGKKSANNAGPKQGHDRFSFNVTTRSRKYGNFCFLMEKLKTL